MGRSLNLVADFSSPEAMAECLRDLADELLGESRSWKRIYPSSNSRPDLLYDQPGCWAHVITSPQSLTEEDMQCVPRSTRDRHTANDPQRWN